MRKIYLLVILQTVMQMVYAGDINWNDGFPVYNLNLSDGLSYMVEAQGSLSNHKTPLWLNANKYGLSSLESVNGYGRVSLMRPLQTDSVRRWGVGYGLDVAVAHRNTSTFVVQQAFVEMRWLHGVLSVGSKQWPMELKNNRLSSGSQTLGINARPVPQVRLSLPEYWVLPFGNGMLRVKGHLAYGKMTDDNWQHAHTGMHRKYTDDVMYHSKAGYIMIGNPDRFMPLSLELGLEMAAQYGGTMHNFLPDGTEYLVKGNSGLKGMWNAFVPGGADATELSTVYQNAEGNHVGSWVMRLNYDADEYRVSLYGDKYFEDHSSMFLLDYDGYGTGSEWNKKKKSKFFLYDLSDWMLGFELSFKYKTWLKSLVFEYISSEYQSGPIYHDHTEGNEVHIGGNDNFYNHYIYPGWQHWGQAIGNPLYRSPLYNDNEVVSFQNNRMKAFHLGAEGLITDRLSYRLLATHQYGFGTYQYPYAKKRSNTSFMLETTYSMPKDWQITGAYGMDFGKLLGNNAGVQFTIRKSGLLKKMGR